MNEQLEEAMSDAILAAELETGVPFDFNTVYEVLKYSIRKLEVIGKEMDYLPLLFENELRDHVMREEINRRGELNRVLNMSSVPV